MLVQPGAASTATPIAGVQADRLGIERLKLRIDAPAVDGKANKALVACMARLTGLKKSQVTLTKGHTARTKTLLLQTENPDLSLLTSPAHARMPDENVHEVR